MHRRVCAYTAQHVQSCQLCVATSLSLLLFAQISSPSPHGKVMCRYGLTDIQEYYANTGALKQAATDAQGLLL